jgi:uncharacterized membrane protein
MKEGIPMKVLSVLGIILLAVAIFILETPNLIRKNDQRGFGCCLILVVIGCIFNITVIVNPRMGSPLDTINQLYQPLTNWIAPFLLGG